MRVLRGISIASSALFLSWSRPAAAQEPQPSAAAPAPARQGTVVRLVAPPCTGVPFDRSRLLELLRVELLPLGVSDLIGGNEPDGSPPPAPALDGDASAVVLVAPFACDDVPEIALTIADRATRKTVTRRLNVADVDAAGRPRVIAIAIAELLGASWVEFALSASPGTPTAVPENAQRALASRLVPAVSALGVGSIPTAPAPPLETRAEEQGDRARPWRIDASAITRLFPSRSTAVLGAAIGASYALSPGIRIHAGGELAFGDADVPVGSIRTSAATGSLGVGFATGGAVELEIEPHLVLGAGWATGESDDANVKAHTYTDWLGVAAVSGTLRARSGAFRPFVTLELGQTFASVAFFVDEARAAGFGGAMFGARVGAGWDL